jgi:FkbM family methyltransferase
MMVDINDLSRAGHSTTKRAWITNPVRRYWFLVARPYFAELIQTQSKFSTVVARQEDVDRFDAALRQHSDDIAVLRQQSDDIAVLRQQSDDIAVLRQQSDDIAVLRQQSDDIAALRQHSADGTTSLRLSTAMKEEIQRLGGWIDGLRKDQLAWTYRLGSLEDGLDRGREKTEDLKGDLTEQIIQIKHQLGALEQQVKAIALHVEAIHAPTGMATLMPHQPLALPGTSLVLNSGPYGCFVLRQPDLISDHILAGSFWDSHLKPVIERASRPNGSAIDAGAYLGFHSAYMSRFFRVVYSYEPQVEIYRMLCANLLLNNCHNVNAVNGALYDITGYVRLADNECQEIPLPIADGAVDYDRVANAAALAFQLTDESDPKRIRTETIDRLNLIDLAFIKVDTQGSDLHVLKGARTTIQRCRPVIAAEFERELAQFHGDTLDDYYQYFDEMAYDVQVLDNRNDGKQIDLLASPR